MKFFKASIHWMVSIVLTSHDPLIVSKQNSIKFFKMINDKNLFIIFWMKQKYFDKLIWAQFKLVGGNL